MIRICINFCKNLPQIMHIKGFKTCLNYKVNSNMIMQECSQDKMLPVSIKEKEVQAKFPTK